MSHDTKKIVIFIAAGMFLTGCSAGKILLQQAEAGKTEAIDVQTTGDMEYCAVRDTYAYSQPFANEEKGTIHIRKGVTISFTEIRTQKEGGSQSVWGQYEDGWIPIQTDGVVYMEKALWEEDKDFDTSLTYIAKEDVYGYEEPSMNASAVVKMPAQTEMKFIKALLDSSYNTWAQDTQGDWYLVQSSTETYFALQSDVLSQQSEDEKEQSVQSQDSQVQETPVEQIIVEKPVYIYETQPYTYSDSYYILPYSSTYLLDDSDLYGLSAQELCYARNEIYARHGRMFVSSELQNYFNSQGWYSPSIAPEDFPESLLSSVETQNIQTILNRENAIGMYYPAP